MVGNRVLGFDFLRGVCAVAVAYYHIFGWLSVTPIKLYNLGLYGVYLFFILSGASIYVAYAEKIRSGYDLRKFLALRLFRLLPLFTLVVMIGPYVDYGNLKMYDSTFFYKALLNVTFAFGIGNPGEISLATGGWSLGIEFLFYLLFPAILAFVSGSLISGAAFLVSVFILQVFYIHHQVPGPGGFSNWVGYVQFLSFSGYFVAGCFLGRLLTATNFSAAGIKFQSLFWSGFTFFCLIVFLTSGETAGGSVIGVRGVLIPIICVLLVFSSAHIVFPSNIKTVAASFGHMSYGMYLLHPLVFTLAGRFFPEFIHGNLFVAATTIIFATSILALIVERYFERPINNFGKRLLRNLNSSNRIAYQVEI